DDLIDSEIYIPEDLEFVLSLTGATAGSLIAYVWPSMIHRFLRRENEHKKELFLNIFLFIGIVIFCICSIATFFEFEPTKENDEILSNDKNSFTTTSLKRKMAFPMDRIINKMVSSKMKILPEQITRIHNNFKEKIEER
ncbi:hypothetical protein BpHYR1_035178, partial [Brachionus plicatilis]